MKDLKIELSYKLKSLLTVLSIFLSIFGFYIFSNFIGNNQNLHLENYGGSYFEFVIIGVLSAQISVIFCTTMSREVRRMQLSGVFEYYIMSEKNISHILIGMLIFPVFFLIIRISIFLCIGIFLFKANINLSLIQPLTYLGILFFIISLIGVGLISCASTIYFKFGEYINGIFLTSTAVLSGVAYPLSALPFNLDKASLIFPNTYLLEMVRRDLNSHMEIQYDPFSFLIPILFISIFLLILGYISCKYSIKYSKKNGTLLNY